MKTLTVTAARQSLGRWLKRAARGEDIGVVVDGRIVAFRPVEVFPSDYAEVEYGVESRDLDRFAEAVEKELAADLRRGRLKQFSGKLAGARTRRTS
jgi:hypothetical protein